MSTFTTPIKHGTGIPSQCNKARKRIKGIIIENNNYVEWNIPDKKEYTVWFHFDKILDNSN